MSEPKAKLSLFDISLALLSIYVLVALLLQYSLTLSEQTYDLIDTIDNIICIFFLYDFFQRLINAKSRLSYMKWGWLDLISSIPMVDVFRLGRAFRIFRVFRALRAVRSTRLLIRLLFENRPKSAFILIMFIAVLMTLSCAILVLHFESGDPEAKIRTSADALWWAFVTVSTVGYGDLFPITIGGKCTAAVLMITGVGLFGTITATIASLLLKTDEQTPVASHLSEIDSKLNRLFDAISEKKGENNG